MTADMTTITRNDLRPCKKFMPPKGSFVGELRTPGKEIIANVYNTADGVIIANPVEYGHGECDNRLEGAFPVKCFVKCGGFRLSASRFLQYWRFRSPEEIAARDARKAGLTK